MKKETRGRKKLPKGEAKSKMIRARVTPAEFEAVERSAAKSGKLLSDWARNVIMAAASHGAA